MATAKRPVGRPKKDATPVKRGPGRPKKAAVAALKKVAPSVKKVAALKILPANGMFDSSWSIKRDNYIVSFGCGEVKVRRADLALLGQNREVLEAFQRVWDAAQKRSYSYYNAQKVLNILKDSKTVLGICGC